MARYKLTIEYDGTQFSGWQKQKDAISVQGEIEKAIYKFCREKTCVYGSGRTDAGVHAFGQVAHSDITKECETYSIRDALNHYMKDISIAILSAEKVDDNFHARFGAKKRSYIYKIINRRAKLTLDAQRYWHVIGDLNIDDMRKSANDLIGIHDFSSFRSAECQAQDAIRLIYEINIKKYDDNIDIEISAKSFLHNQVRIIVGTLYDIGRGRRDIGYMKYLLKVRERTKAGQTAPPHGLYLKEIFY